MELILAKAMPEKAILEVDDAVNTQVDMPRIAINIKAIGTTGRPCSRNTAKTMTHVIIMEMHTRKMCYVNPDRPTYLPGFTPQRQSALGGRGHSEFHGRQGNRGNP
jgi:hypothetical protein